MKAVLLRSKFKNEEYKEVDTEIKNLFKELNVSLDDSFVSTSVHEDAQTLEDFFKKTQKLLKDTDFVIAETTEYSSGIGYLIANALNNKKPVLSLYNKNSNTVPSNVIKANSNSKYLTFKEYEKPEDLKNIVKSFINEVKQKLDTKFILIIPAEIDRYLEWASSHRRMHKAQIVRDAVEETMKEDKEWQNVQ